MASDEAGQPFSFDTVDLPLDVVRPYWNNPRRNELAVEAVAASIARYGMNQPLVLDTEQVIIVGDTRYRALRLLQWETAPCIIRDLPADAAREYRIADNKTHELALWHTDKLVAELRETGAEAMRQFWLDPTEVDRLLDGLSHAPAASVSGESWPKPMRQVREQIEAPTDPLPVTCPDCGEDFVVDRAYLLS